MVTQYCPKYVVWCVVIGIIIIKLIVGVLKLYHHTSFLIKFCSEMYRSHE